MSVVQIKRDSYEPIIVCDKCGEPQRQDEDLIEVKLFENDLPYKETNSHYIMTAHLHRSSCYQQFKSQMRTIFAFLSQEELASRNQ